MPTALTVGWARDDERLIICRNELGRHDRLGLLSSSRGDTHEARFRAAQPALATWLSAGPGDNPLDHVALGIRVVLDVFPLLPGQLTFPSLVELTVGLVDP